MTTTKVTIHRLYLDDLDTTLTSLGGAPLSQARHPVTAGYDVTPDPAYLTVYLTETGMQVLQDRANAGYADWYLDSTGRIWANGGSYKTETIN